MNNVFFKTVLAASLLAALTACDNESDNVNVDDHLNYSTCADAGDACQRFTLLHTNDNHGRFWENSHGEYGMAARKALIDAITTEVESAGGEILLLSGGDINTGVPESDLQDARPDFVGMNLIGYDAMAVGNHEFDNPLSVLEMQRELADFPMLAANIYDNETGERYFDPYKIFEINGLRIAVIGLTTEDTVKIGNPEYISGLRFTDPKVEVQQVINEINAANSADVIFATTHMGHYADGQHGSNAPGDVALARALNEGALDAIVGGHSQNPVCMEANSNDYADFQPTGECIPDKQNGTYIMQAFEWGKYVGRADFEFYNQQLHLVNYRLIPVNIKVKNEEGERVLVAAPITPDATVKEILSQYQQKGQEELNEVIATTDALFDGERANVRTQQTNLGHLIATAHMLKVNADIGIMNSGGVRASIEAGDITYKDVLTVQPFGNTLTKSTMTGAEITAYLSDVATKQVGSGAYAQLVGVSMSVDCQNQSVSISDINNKGFSETESYSFTVPSFNAAGGDGYPVIDPVMTGYVDAEVLYSFFKQRTNIVASEFTPSNQVVYTNSDSVNGCLINESKVTRFRRYQT